MKARAYLAKLNKLDSMIRNRAAEIERWKTAAVDCSVKLEGERVQSSGSKQRMADAVETYVDLQAELEDCILKSMEERRAIISTIERLPVNQYNVLFLVYAQGLQIKEVEKVLNRSHTWVCTTHRKALVNLQKILDERERKK